MKSLKKVGAVIALLISTSSALAAPHIHPYPPEVVAVLASGIDRVLIPVGATHQWGIMVTDVATGQVIYTHQADAWMTPASTQKIVTAVVATKELGERYRFKTRLWTSGLIKKGVLHGSVTLEFSGDPTLAHSDVLSLLVELKKSGIHRITGSVYLDTHSRSPIPYAPGWMWDDLSFRHGAPAGAIVIDENSFPIELIWSKKHRRAILKQGMPKGSVRFSNKVKKQSGSVFKCPLLVYSHDNNHYELSGCMPHDRSDKKLWLAIRNPKKYASFIVRDALKNMNIQGDGRIEEHRKARHSHLLATHYSKALPVLIKKMLKESDNVIANALLEALGAHHYHEAGSWQNGTQTVKERLGKLLGLPENSWRIVDGSGASRYNVLSPHVLVSLLESVYQDPLLARVIISALPTGGKDGTLKERMRSAGLRGVVHAKTGTMTGVSALSGFINRPDGHVLVFAVMANGLLSRARMAHAWEDAVCQVLTQDVSSIMPL